MKIEVNDRCGSAVLQVFRLDGTVAVKNEDYVSWSGKYYKQGRWSYNEGGVALKRRWSYTEGGVALKNGSVLINRRSTHDVGNNVKSLIFVRDNQMQDFTIIGKWHQQNCRPKNGYKKLITDEAFDSIIEWLLDYYEEKTPGSKAEKLNAWELYEKFA
jgi:hypothetical protein